MHDTIIRLHPKDHESVTLSLEEEGNGGCIPEHWGITGFAVQQQDLQLLDSVGSIPCAVTRPLFRNGCHHILAAVRSGQIVLSQCWQGIWLFYNGGHHILVTTTVLKKGREKEVIHDQHTYILWPFVLGNGIAFANHIPRSQEQGILVPWLQRKASS